MQQSFVLVCRAQEAASGAQGTAGKFASHASNAAQGKPQAGDTLWQKTKDTLTGQQHRGAAADLGTTTGQYINAAANKASDYANEAKSAAGEFAHHASASAKGESAGPGVLQKIKDTLTGSSAPSHEYAAQAGAATGQYAGATGQQAKQYASEQYANAKAAASAFSEHAVEYAQGSPSIWSKVKSTLTGTTTAASAGATAGQYARSAADSASEAAQNAKVKASAAAGSAADYARDSAYNTKDAAGTFAQHASDRAQGKPQGVFDKVRNLLTGESSHPAAAGDTAGEYARGVADAAGQHISSAQEKLGSASSDASQYASNTAGDLKHQASQFVDHASAAAQGKQPGVWDKLKNTVTGHANDGANAGDTAGQYVNSAGQYAQVPCLLPQPRVRHHLMLCDLAMAIITVTALPPLHDLWFVVTASMLSVHALLQTTSCYCDAA